MALAGPKPDEMPRQQGIAAVFEQHVAGAAQDEVDLDGFVGVPLAQVEAPVGQGHGHAGAAGPELERGVAHLKKR